MVVEKDNHRQIYHHPPILLQVRIIVGDSVSVELSAYDLTRGRITYRNK